MEFNKKIAVIGGGSWATAIVKILTENLEVVNWWMSDQSCVDHIKKFHHNPKYIQSIPNDSSLSADQKRIVLKDVMRGFISGMISKGTRGSTLADIQEARSPMSILNKW